MKRILITGVNSYVGNSVERYLMEYNAAQGREWYRVDKITLRDETWENTSFGTYDAILHVAGIAHADIGRVSEETKALYYQVNCELAVKVAEKAKGEGVSQFIYLSSVIVYGDSAGAGGQKHIMSDTVPQPSNFYGDSKYQAELKLQKLQAGDFHIAIIRPPMIYGRGSKGNFPTLVKMADKLPFFPSMQNQRSMLYVENLSEFIRLLTESGQGGTFFPQNSEYVTTAQLVRAIGEAKGRNIRLLGVLNPLVKLASKVPGRIGGMANKAFGSLTIDQGLSNRGITGYRVCSLEESIKRSVGQER